MASNSYCCDLQFRTKSCISTLLVSNVRSSADCGAVTFPPQMRIELLAVIFLIENSL
jgi:hypothetical protein